MARLIRSVMVISVCLGIGISGCGKKSPETEPSAEQKKTDPVAPEKADAGTQTGDAATTEETTPVTANAPPEKEENKRPSWVDNPQSFYPEPRPDMVLAVGSARLTAPGMERIARSMAQAAARANLSEAMSDNVTKVEKTVTKDGATNSTLNSVVRVQHDGILRGPQTLAYWNSDDGQVFVLMGAEKPKAQDENK